MGWYLRKSFRLAPGVRLNLSRSGLGLSVGTRGARIGVGPRGAYVHAGVGGLYYRKTLAPAPRRPGARRRGAGAGRAGPPPGAPAGRSGAPGGGPGGAEVVRAYPDGQVQGSSAAGALGCLGLLLVAAALALPWLWPLALGALAGAAALSWKDGQLRRTWQQAAEAFRNGRWDEARRLLEPLLSRHPQEADLWLLWGLTLWRAGSIHEAASALLRVDQCADTLGRLAATARLRWEVEFQPWPLRVELPSAPGLDLVQAYLLAQAGRHEEALAQLDGALGLNPGFHAARLLKALILVDAARSGARGDDAFHQAVALLQQIPRDDPLYLWAVAAMGQAFREAGQPELAVTALRPATRFRRDPEALKAIRYELALAYHALGDRRRAREQLARIVTEDIGYRDARRLLEQWNAAGSPGTAGSSGGAGAGPAGQGA
ncbi:hypothetical protein Tmar_0549 [Thermaerobacter marianensis DSM 12885]|uniref:DUF4236 domain-containing protein n=1 Tax=Thermaerobacter marianensis (strain ATCC 700841 / DSM 12885 / JCM 10246 / 7p75a) TaxID=644966 RepID=E6SHA6_THEM7|nr:DUF4236 domain-containing protein [Thermaerobacter marianensis]ADU50670.1 hypothetical protein Tmar_0549 [Thermaerobacter marianensis DSM 12885]